MAEQFAIIKTESLDEEVTAITPSRQQNPVLLRSPQLPTVGQGGISPSIKTGAAITMPQLGQATIRPGNGTPTDSNAKTGSATYIPAILHEYYRQASAIFKIDYICALCSKPLKCRSARDMRDHALSHGGAHWASAFRCLLCTYHSHSRRSVAKHVTTAHLIPDGVQCAPGELMENEIFSRQDELLALVRDCFPLHALPSNQSAGRPAMAASGFPATRTVVDNGMMDISSMALPVEMSQSATANVVSNGSISGILQRYNAATKKTDVQSAFEVREEDETCNYDDNTAWTDGSGAQEEDAMASPHDDPGIMEGWTVVEDGAESNGLSEYDNGVQEPEGQAAKGAFTGYPTRVADAGSSTSRKSSNAPVLEGLLRDFQFQPNSFVRRHQQQAPTQRTTTFCPPAPPPSQEPDDPRALIERLLNVVAPDVARFLLEEAIRARATAAKERERTALSSAPTIESVTGSVSVVGPIRRLAPPTMVPRPTIRPVVGTSKSPMAIAAAVIRQKQDRLGKIGAFKCPECQAIFKRRRYLERHIRARHRLHCYRCTMSGCSFSNARELWYVRRHHAKHHANETVLVCQFCSQVFPNSDEMTSRHHACCSLSPRKGNETADSSLVQASDTAVTIE